MNNKQRSIHIYQGIIEMFNYIIRDIGNPNIKLNIQPQSLDSTITMHNGSTYGNPNYGMYDEQRQQEIRRRAEIHHQEVNAIKEIDPGTMNYFRDLENRLSSEIMCLQTEEDTVPEKIEKMMWLRLNKQMIDQQEEINQLKEQIKKIT